jgi:hypothetical protein
MNKNQNYDTTKKSHFINIPIAFNDDNFIKEYKLFMDKINEKGLDNISPHLFQKPYKLHMTVCTLNIGEDNNKIEKCNSIMKSINSKMEELAKGGISFNFQKYETLGSVTKARVLYAEMLQDESYKKLCEIINLIIQTLLAEGLMGDEEIKQNYIEYNKTTNQYSIKLHLTLLNVLFWNKILKKERKKPLNDIDFSKLLELVQGNLMLPSTNITQINFSRMREDKKTEMYELLYSYKF